MRAASALLLFTLVAALPAIAQQPTPAGAPAASAAPPGQTPSQELDHYRKLANDYGALGRYAAANAALPPAAPGERRVVFYGDSITDAWHLDQSFPGRAYLNRGIGGQTTPQMLVRFRQDVIDLHPAVLVLLAGTNDLAGNTGPETLTQIEDDYATMAELCRVHGIRMVFSSVMPVNDLVHPDMSTHRRPADIAALNSWMRQYAAANGLVYLDYYTSTAGPDGKLRRELSGDGLHPNTAGYAVMAPLAQSAVNQALSAPAPVAMAAP